MTNYEFLSSSLEPYMKTSVIKFGYYDIFINPDPLLSYFFISLIKNYES